MDPTSRDTIGPAHTAVTRLGQLGEASSPGGGKRHFRKGKYSGNRKQLSLCLSVRREIAQDRSKQLQRSRDCRGSEVP